MIELDARTIMILMLVAFIIGLMIGVSLSRPRLN